MKQQSMQKPAIVDIDQVDCEVPEAGVAEPESNEIDKVHPNDTDKEDPETITHTKSRTSVASTFGELDESKEETEKERQKREKEEFNKKLEEFGGKIGFCTLLSLATPGEKVVFFLGCFGAMAHGFGQVSIQFFFGDLTDALGSGEGVMDEMTKGALKLVAVGFGCWFAASLYGFCFPWFVERQMQKIRPMYFDAILHRDIGWYDTHEAGSLSAEMMSDVDQYAEGMGMKFANSWMSASMFISGYIVAFTKSWKLTLVMTASLPCMFLGMGIAGKAAQDTVKEEQGGYRKAASIIDECLYAIRTVVSFGGEAREIKRFGVAVEKARWAGVMTRVKIGCGMGYFMGATPAST
jgi:hypothetical protein